MSSYFICPIAGPLRISRPSIVERSSSGFAVAREGKSVLSNRATIAAQDYPLAFYAYTQAA